MAGMPRPTLFPPPRAPYPGLTGWLLGVTRLQRTQGQLQMVVLGSPVQLSGGPCKRFQVEPMIVSHDTRRMNFGERTNFHQTMLMCRLLYETDGSGVAHSVRRVAQDAIELRRGD